MLSQNPMQGPPERVGPGRSYYFQLHLPCTLCESTF